MPLSQKIIKRSVPDVGNAPFLLMFVVADMILTIAVISLAAGAVPEFQFRVRYIGATADSAPVGIIGFCVNGGLVGERDGSNNSCLCCWRCLAGPLAEFCPPGQGEDIQNIPPHKQQIVGDSHQGEEIVREVKHGETQINNADCN